MVVLVNGCLGKWPLGLTDRSFPKALEKVLNVRSVNSRNLFIKKSQDSV